MAYKAVYQCLRCGAQFEGRRIYQDDEVSDDVKELAVFGRQEISLSLHECGKGGAMGLGYLVGFDTYYPGFN